MGIQCKGIKDINKKHVFLFWAILVLALLARSIQFAKLPAGINPDEAMGAMDAWALSLYGTDRFGVSLPVHFSAWQVSQMSVLLAYLTVPFIWVFGFSTWSVRLPMLLVSVGAVALMYLVGKRLAGVRFGLVAMALTAVNPWHYMQSRWAIDCNLFPHVFLLAFYLLLLGLEKRRYLYLSMFFFGLTFYCYGIAVYSVTPFLAVFALWGLRKKLFAVREVLWSVVIFGVTALPEVLVLVINLLHLDTMKLGPLTLSRFPETLRGTDILFLNFSFAQLGKNIWAMVRSAFLQLPDYWFNAIPMFGPMYHVSIPFMAAGIFLLIRDLSREKDAAEKAGMMAWWGFLLMGIWVGVITHEVNVNRINIIFYPLILVCGYGICRLADVSRKAFVAVGVVYGLCAALFLGAYFTVYPKESAKYYNGEFLEAVTLADRMEYDSMYITGSMGWQFNESMADILTQYACRVDAEYYQGKTTGMGGRQLLPYYERYHFINAWQFDWEGCDRDALYLMNEEELYVIPQDYEVLTQVGQFYLLDLY